MPPTQGPPVLNDEERLVLVDCVKWVDEVITGGARGGGQSEGIQIGINICALINPLLSHLSVCLRWGMVYGGVWCRIRQSMPTILMPTSLI